MPQPSDIKVPSLEPVIPRMSRDEAAAAWFVFLETTRAMGQMKNPAFIAVSHAILDSTRRVGEKIRGMDKRSIDYIIRENARAEIINGT